MVRSAPRRLRTGLVVAVSVLALGVVGAPFASAAPDDPAAPASAPAAKPGRYIVTLTQKPVASYRGGVSGYPATRPSSGRRVDVGSGAAKRYRQYVAHTQDGVAAEVGARVRQRYSVSLNAFVADLTPQQAERLKSTKGVLGVSKDVLRKPLSNSNNVDFLDLTGKKGVWSKVGGTKKAGRGVVVGVIDTGVWPESASFAGPALGSDGPTAKDPYRPYRVGDQVRMVKSDGSVFVGTCQTGASFVASDCNTKLISARYFGKSWLEDDTPGADEYISPRDGDEHGTHTASTAAGNAKVKAVINGRSFGTISGVAPAAKVAVYKALWTAAPGKGEDGGSTSDILEAIDQAVADGVDVINYSVGGSSESDIIDPVQVAFLDAASAGVFVSASAGNSGPGASTLDNTSPWVTTVAASSIKARYGTVELGNGERYPGVTNTVDGKVGPVPLVAAAGVRVAGATEADAARCTAGTLDPAKVAGKVVVCDRGVSARVDKSAEVKRAGGVGMVLANLTDNSLDGDLHTVPTIILNPPASTAIKTYATTAGATVTLREGNTSKTKIPYPQIAGFSSRGPSLSNAGDLLKPDLAAPGVDILAASAPNTGNNQAPFNFLSGTSMAAPQVAGLAAIYFGKHPRYSPMSVKSALMTTAADTVDAKNHKVHDAYAQGAGNVVPKRMLDPGVVLDSSDADWLAYLEGQGFDTESGVRAIDPSDYNAPSIAVGSLVSKQTVVRRITALRSGTYRIKASVPGFSVRSSVSKLRLRKGQTKTLALTFTRRSAGLGDAAFGTVSIKSSKTNARLPVALTPVAVSAPAEVSGSGTSGSKAYTATAGESGPFPVKASGLVLPRSDEGSVQVGGKSAFYSTTVGAGVPLVRLSVNADADDADIDLFVYRQVGGELEEVAVSATASGDEEVTLDHPEAGVYVAEVRPFTDPTGASSTSFTANSWVVKPGTTGNFAVNPATPVVKAGEAFTLTPTWQGLQSGKSYLGWVEYLDGTGTVVSVSS